MSKSPDTGELHVSDWLHPCPGELGFHVFGRFVMSTRACVFCGHEARQFTADDIAAARREYLKPERRQRSQRGHRAAEQVPREPKRRRVRGEAYALSDLEKRLVLLVESGATYRDASTEIAKSQVRVGKILTMLRKLFNVHTTPELCATLRASGLLP